MNSNDHTCNSITPLFTRRDILKNISCGFGWLAFSGLAGKAIGATDIKPVNPLEVKVPHFPARAKRVIFLTMRGGPSHVDTFDPKPALEKYAQRDRFNIALQLLLARQYGVAGQAASAEKVYQAQADHSPTAEIYRGLQFG